MGRRKSKVESEVKAKRCSQCESVLPLTAFYSKGPGRLDSECRECKKKRVRAKYVPSDMRSAVARVKKLIDAVTDWEISKIKALRREVRQVIMECDPEGRVVRRRVGEETSPQ